MAKEKAIAVQPVAQTGAELMLTDLQNEFAGSVEVRSSLIKIPSIKLCQQMSDAVAGELGKSGEYVCESRGINFGTSVTIIPLLVSESASLMYGMDEGEQGVKCRSNDLIRNVDGVACSSCPHGEYWNDWGTKTEKKVPKCSVALNLIVLTPTNISNEGRMMMSLRKTSHPAGKALVNLIASDPRKIPFGHKYTFHSSSETNPKNKKTYNVTSPVKIDKTPLTDEELLKVIPIARHTLDLKRAGSIVEEQHVQSEAGEADPFI